MTAERTLLFIVHYPVFGGPHNQALQLDEELRSRGWRTIVVLPTEPGNAVARLTAGAIHVIQTPLGRVRALRSPSLQWRYATGFLSDIRRLRAIIREHRPAVVVIGGLVNPQGAIAAKLERVPVVWELLDTRAPRWLMAVAMIWVRSLSNAVLSTGRQTALFHPGGDRLGARLFEYFPPVNLEVFRPDQSQRTAARLRLGFTDADLVVGTVGNLNPQKDHLTFVRAAASLRKQNQSTRFVIFGAPSANHVEYVSAVKREASSRGLVEGVDFRIVDPSHEVAFWLQSLDVFWLTSEPRSEGIPTVIGEAMATGIPVISSNVGSVNEAVIDGVNGFVVEALRPEAFASATARLLSDPARRAALSAGALETARAKFSVSRSADSHISALMWATNAAQSAS